jgi:hypothetical protein
LPGQEGLPPSPLADLVGPIRCEAISLERYDTERQAHDLLQATDADDHDPDPEPPEGFARMFWTHYWDCRVCSFPIRRTAAVTRAFPGRVA